MISGKNKKVLIIDDKAENQHLSSISLIQRLTPDQKRLVDLETNTKELWMLNKNQDEIIELKEDFEQYGFIVLHQSYDDPTVSEPIGLLMPAMPKNTKLILFSGERRVDLEAVDTKGIYNFPQNTLQIHYEIRRSVLYENFSNFLNTYLVSGVYRIEALYDRNFNVKKEKALILFRNLTMLLEESELQTIESKDFKDFFMLAGYKHEEVLLIRKNFSSKGYNEIYEDLENELTKF